MVLVVTKEDELVCECSSSRDALLCVKELIEMDKEDDVFEKGFYKLVHTKEERK